MQTVLSSVRRDNKSYAAKQAIRDLANYCFPCPESVTTMVKNLACLTFIHDVVPVFGDLDDDLKTVGETMQQFHETLDSHMSNYTQSDVFVYGGHDVRVNWVTKIMTGGGDQVVPGAAKFVEDMVTAWYSAANQFDESRRKSATLQLKNQGVSDEDIAAVLADPLLLRTFIAEQRAELVAQLEVIHDKMEADDPLDPLTASEVSLYEKHEEWFDGGNVDEDCYMPNDSAVNYPMLLVEIMAMTKAAGAASPRDVYELTAFIIILMNKHMTIQSARVGWTRLATIGTVMCNGINVGEIIMSYVTDENRCLEAGEKLANPLARSPLRVNRMAQCLFNQPGPFSILNAHPKNMMSLFVECKAKEDRIKELVASAPFAKEGPVDLYISTTVAWLVIMERHTLLHVVTGRNDLSVPKILSSVVALDMTSFADLSARPWSLDHDIIGENEDGATLEELHFAEEQEVKVESTKPPSLIPSLPAPSEATVDVPAMLPPSETAIGSASATSTKLSASSIADAMQPLPNVISVSSTFAKSKVVASPFSKTQAATSKTIKSIPKSKSSSNLLM